MMNSNPYCPAHQFPTIGAVPEWNLRMGYPSLTAVRRTRPLFALICIYVLAQSFMIPIAAIGPSWSVWPTMADIMIVPLIGVALLGCRSEQAVTPYHRYCLKLLAVLVVVASLGLLRTIVFCPEREATMYGFYFLYRFVEFFVLFWAISQMVWTPLRLQRLRIVVDIVLLITCAGVILTFLGVIPLSKLIAHLPQSKEAAGPWVAYLLKEKFPEDGRGVGFVGYNHAYGGVQILALTAFRFGLSRSKVTISSGLLVFIALVASFFTESRAGFAALLFFVGTQFARNPKLLAACVPVALLGLVVLDMEHSEVSVTMERQQTILSATEGDNLSGRQDIWSAYTTYMLDNPATFVFGAGLGASYPVTPNRSCHMTPLQYLFELGFLGVGIYFFVVYQILRLLFLYEGGAKPIFFALVGLQVASWTMETFYPIPYLGHFLGLCLLIASICFSRIHAERSGHALC